MIERAIRIILKVHSKLIGVYRLVKPKQEGLNLIGFFSYTMGIAEIARFFAKRLTGTNVKYILYDLTVEKHSKLDEQSLKAYEDSFSKRTVYDKNIFFCNADYINVVEYRNPALFANRYNVAVFFWEFNDYFNFPDSFRFLNEVVVFTEFIATAIRKVAPGHIKVTCLPIPFIKTWVIKQTKDQVRNKLNIGINEFVFIFSFDFLSVYNRKNPEAVLKAFEQAFSPDSKVRLIFKTIHAEIKNQHYNQFVAIINKMKLQDKIIIINENLSKDEFMSMIDASDCYISLHRSEGLGLGMMEAMSMGKPVIATRYGGNTDFMNNENSLLVDYELVPVEAGSEPYKAGWLWADANVDHAASCMNRLYNDRLLANNIGDRAYQYIHKVYSQSEFSQSLTRWMENA